MRTQQKETLQSAEMPQTRWEQLGLDLFSLKNMHHLLAVDYLSQFPIVRKLWSLHLVSVIKHLKEIFMQIGVPRCIVSDGGTQFTSQEFKDFMWMWDIQYRITPPTNAQSNGQAEHFVQTIKNSHQGHRRRGRSIFSYPLIHQNTLEPQSTLTTRVAELWKAQMLVATPDIATRLYPPIQENNAAPEA